MKVALGADHAGFDLKERLRQLLEGSGHQVVDCGTQSAASTDYPDFAREVARQVTSGEAERGVLACGTGIGMAMAANKVPGARAANCNDIFMAELARRHNDANVLTVGSRVVAPEHAEAIVRTFLETPFDGGRHQKRIDKITSLDGGLKAGS
jgi:ribose 5-phosphate isomerase B